VSDLIYGLYSAQQPSFTTLFIYVNIGRFCSSTPYFQTPSAYVPPSLSATKFHTHTKPSYIYRGEKYCERRLFCSTGFVHNIFHLCKYRAVLYGCETWSLTVREERRLTVFENRVLRRIFGPKRDEGSGGNYIMRNLMICTAHLMLW